MTHTKPELRALQTTNNTHYLIINRPSTPIEIPSRRKRIMSPLPSLPARPMSPDLIFEMSPVYSDFSSPAHYSFSFSVSQKTNDREPFMYHVPKLSGRHGYSTHTTRQNMDICASPPIISSKPHVNVKRYNPLSTSAGGPGGAAPPFSARASSTAKKVGSTTKITGFIPMIPTQPPASTEVHTPAQLSRPLKRLLPSPRTSFASLPWLSSERGKKYEIPSSAETEPSAFEFEKYLTRCIENQKSVRFPAMELVSSMWR